MKYLAILTVVFLVFVMSFLPWIENSLAYFDIYVGDMHSRIVPLMSLLIWITLMLKEKNHGKS